MQTGIIVTLFGAVVTVAIISSLIYRDRAIDRRKELRIKQVNH